ncbi:MAG: alpha/beta hydrolase [Burkholderiales bacterium]|nr:alpha/beta hydrolase [Pseudomonadota bacterium]MCC7067950.1 alpha/beta hydrolase [Burkholderiales bacterium]MCZ2134155.1 lipase family protein [Burkholderiales bacterium]
MKTIRSLALATLAAAVVAACSGGGDVATGPSIDLGNARGTLVANPPVILTSMPTAADVNATFSASPSGRSLLQLAGTPKCGVNFHYMEYNTVGGKGEATNATGGIMVPLGTDAACSGPRPVLLYSHGTTVEKAYNIASPANGEAALLAAFYAAQGFVVVTSNYAGYDASRLPYHPYLNAEQQSNDMIDALRAARKAFPNIGVNDSGKLFLAGYSQGGFVSMATHRAMQNNFGSEFKVTASGNMSGPYSLVKTFQTVFAGGVNLGATIFTPMIFTSWQNAYGNLYSSPSDAYEAPYANGIETLLPGALSTTQLYATGKLPGKLFATGALVTGNPSLDALFANGIGTPNLVKQSYRQAVMTNPQHNVWVATAKNDLLGWTPARPVAMCFGAQDPVVFASNTADAAASFASKGAGALVKVMNVEDAATVGPTLAGAFAGAVSAAAADPSLGATPTERVLGAYHGTLVPPFCNVAVRGFFQSVLASGQ